MSALRAIVRVSDGKSQVLAFSPAGDLSPMSTALVETALSRAKPADGVHRLTVSGSDVSLARVGTRPPLSRRSSVSIRKNVN